MEKFGMNVEFKGKVYNPKALSKGTLFGVQVSNKDANGEWHNKFINVYTPDALVLHSKDVVTFSGFMTIDPPYKERPEEFKIIASRVQVVGDGAVNNRNVVDNTSKPAKQDYGF